MKWWNQITSNMFMDEKGNVVTVLENKNGTATLIDGKGKVTTVIKNDKEKKNGK